MPFVLINIDTIIELHDEIIGPQELPGLAKDKSLEAALARVEHRLHYGLVEDGFDLAACYAMVIATGHCFNDANKRTAFFVMVHILSLHNIKHNFNNIEVAKKIIYLAQGAIDETTFATWLRKHSVQK